MAAAIPNSGPHLVDQVHVVNESYLHPHFKKMYGCLPVYLVSAKDFGK